MKINTLLILLTAGAAAQTLEIHPSEDGVQLRWDRSFPPNSGVPAQLESRVLTSSDLRNWTQHSLIQSEESEGEGVSILNLPIEKGSHFFTLESQIVYSHRSSDSQAPALYGRQYDNAYNRDLTLVQFWEQVIDPDCPDSIDWDPRTSTFFDVFNTSPEEHNFALPEDDPERRVYDFTLNEEELALFDRSGFVVSPRVSAYSGPLEDQESIAPTPVDLYYALWTDDLPVFITADSVLDAWHQSFSSILEELDEIVVYPSVKQLVKDNWPSAIESKTSAWPWDEMSPEENDRMQDAIDLVNFYMDLAKAFLDTEAPTSSDIALDWYGDLADPDPKHLVKDGLYGDDFRLSRPNLYKPRGRYARTGVLSAHFRTLVWLSRAQFHIAHSDGADLVQRNRELRAAVLLALTIRDGGLMDDWKRIEAMLRGIAGQSDAMTIEEMIALLEANSLDNLTTIASETSLSVLREALLASTYGIQEINGGYYEFNKDGGPCQPNDTEQPRALSLFGQRWTPDAWNFQKLVFPEVRDEGTALYRRLPSGLDVAYSTFANDAAAPILVERMLDQEGVTFRDGYPTHKNLAAVRSAFDSQKEEFWTEHLYGRWIHGLRALSDPPPMSAPDTFHTTSWKRRILNTQLASWTQLRHDTLLYAKQSFTPPNLCHFPDGYVEPYPELWQRLSEIAQAYGDYISSFEFEGVIGLEAGNETPEQLRLPTKDFTASEGYAPTLKDTSPEIYSGRIITVDRGERLIAIQSHLENFSQQCLKLKAIAESQMSGLPHSDDMRTFIESTVEDFSLIGYADHRLYNGWFPGLYFENVRQAWGEHPSSSWSPVVADVHTDARDTICAEDPGAVLHQGTGKTQFMLVSVKHSDGTACAYGGPVMSHYEFTTSLGTRLSDEQWKETLDLGQEPDFAAWKQGFMVPALDE